MRKGRSGEAQKRGAAEAGGTTILGYITKGIRRQGMGSFVGNPVFQRYALSS